MRKCLGCYSSSSILFLFTVLLLVSTSAFAEAVYEQGAPDLPAQAQVKDAPSFTGLAKALSPAVVNITVESSTASASATSDAPEGAKPDAAKPDTAKPEAAPKELDPGSQFKSSGSGFIISPEGYIVTSNHVIDKSNSIVVRLLDDKTEYQAKVVGKDKKTDLALLKIDAKKKLPIAYLADSDSIEVGEWVLAIGNQFELGQTVTAGIISAKSRRVPSKDSGPYDQFIQTDASINPGSSGGPLFNMKGQVIGVNTAIYTPGRNGVGFNIGIGFAIPSNLVKEIVTQLKDKGKVTRAMLGIIVQPIDNAMAEALNLPVSGGALVADVIKDSPAYKSGFQQKDVVTNYDGHVIDDYEDLPILVSSTPIGKSVSVDVLRKGAKQTLQVQVQELQEPKSNSERKSAPADMLGLRVDTLPEDLRKNLKLGVDEGVLVLSVEPNSRAEAAGVVPGDVILELRNEKINGLEPYKKALEALPKDKASLLLLQKKDGTHFIALKPR